jgi:hypothetical protein
MFPPFQGPLEFELGQTGPSVKPAETKFQRFQRLQAEVKSLLDEIGDDVGKQEAVQQVQEPLPSYVHRELKALHQQLESAIGDEKIRRVLLPSSGEYLAMTTSVDDVLQRAVNAVHAGSAAAPSPSVTYELYATPLQGTAQNAAFAALERRLTRLEQALGQPGQGLPLWDEVKALQSQMEILDMGKLDDLSNKFRNAAEAIASYERERKLNPAASASVAAPVMTETKVAQMLEILDQWSAFAGSLPTIVARLRALREV